MEDPLIVIVGISTVLSAAVVNTTTDEITIENLETFNLNIGDYLRLDNEIVRIKSTVSANPVKVFRGVFGTKSSTHVTGTVVRRVDILPVELRRTSIIRSFLVIHLNILDMVQVTTLHHSHRDGKSNLV